MSRRSSTMSPDYDLPLATGTPGSSLSHEDAKRMYARTQQRWSQTHEQLNSAMRVRTTSPLNSAALRQNDSEIASLRTALAQIQGQMTAYEQMLHEANATIARQEKTILTQSKAIENPRPGRDFETTPRRQRHNNAAGGATGGQVARPDFALQGQNGAQMPMRSNQSQYDPAREINTNMTMVPYQAGGSTAFGNNSTGHSPQRKAQQGAARNQRSRNPAALQHPPSSTPAPQQQFHSQAMRPHNAVQGGARDPFGPGRPASRMQGGGGRFQKYQSWEAFESPSSVGTNPHPETRIPFGTASSPASIAGDETGMKEAFKKVFDMAQDFALKHVNCPSTHGDSTLPQDVKNRLLNAATMNTAFQIMSQKPTRYLLVSKVMITWIIKHILKFNAFSGLDPNIDQIIAGAKATIYQSTPPQLKYLILANITNEVHKLRARADFSGFVQHLAEQRATQLLAIVRPMMHQKPQNDAEDLVAVLKEAYKLAEAMFTTTNEYSFHFHTFSAYFDDSEMINIDPVYGFMKEDKLRKVGAAVKLGATPVVRIRENEASGASAENILLKGKVILKKVYG